jgi:hypothetical protein
MGLTMAQGGTVRGCGNCASNCLVDEPGKCGERVPLGAADATP